MRPVIHPPQPGPNEYPTFRVDTLAHLRADLEVYPWNSTSYIPYEMFDRTREEGLSAWDALNGCLLDLIRDPPPKPATKKRKFLTMADVQTYAEDWRDRTYKLGQELLYDSLGRFCSYCEQKVTETVAIEHVVSKAPYPLTSVSWANFLLSCRACNSKKGSKPARDVDWLEDVIDGGDEVAVYDAIREHYLLPDDSDNAFFSLPPVLCAKTAKGWMGVPRLVSVSNALTRTAKGTAKTKQPKASVPYLTGAKEMDVRVLLVPTAPSNIVAQASVELLGLSASGVGSSDDNRTWSRTTTWLCAVKEFSKLNDHNANFASQWDSLCEIAGQTGFLTVWIQVLALRGGAVAPYPPPPAIQTSTFLTQFLQVMTQGAEPEYPNTDLNVLPPHTA